MSSLCSVSQSLQFTLSAAIHVVLPFSAQKNKPSAVCAIGIWTVQLSLSCQYQTLKDYESGLFMLMWTDLQSAYQLPERGEL